MYRKHKDEMVMQAGPIPKPAMDGNEELKCPKCQETLWEGIKGYPGHYCFKCGEATMQVKSSKSLPLDYLLKRGLVNNVVRSEHL
jgi:hypothetical protein